MSKDVIELIGMVEETFPNATFRVRILSEQAKDHQLHCTLAGRMRVQEAGGPVREFGPRQSAVTEPGIKHWHGAGPNERLTQVALSFGATSALTDPSAVAQVVHPRRLRSARRPRPTW